MFLPSPVSWVRETSESATAEQGSGRGARGGCLQAVMPELSHGTVGARAPSSFEVEGLVQRALVGFG